MLRNFRSVFKSQRAPMVAVMAVVGLGMVAYLAPTNRGNTPDLVVARAYGREVLFGEMARLAQSYGEAMRRQYGGQYPPDLLYQAAQSQALQELLRNRLVDELAERQGIVFTDEEVRSALERRLRQEAVRSPELFGLFGTDGHIKPMAELEKAFRIESLKSYLHQEEANARKMLLGEKLLKLAAFQVPVDEAWVAAEDRARHEKVSFEALTLRPDPASVADPGDATLEAYLKASGRRFEEGPRRVLQVASVDRATLGDLKVDDAALQQAYEQKRATFSQGPQVKARHILFTANSEAEIAEAMKKAVALRAKLVKGGDFAKAADEESQDPTAKGSGGDLGWFTKDRMVKEFSEAAFALKPGEISQPVKTQFGVHLIKLEGTKPEQVTPFEQVKEQLRQELEEARFEAKAKERLEALRKRAGTGDLSNAAKALGLKLEVLPPFSQNAAEVKGLPPGSPFLSLAFTQKLGETTKAIRSGEGWAVARVQQELPVTVPPLAEVRPKVLLAWRTEEARRQLEARVKEQLKGGDLRAAGTPKVEGDQTALAYGPAAAAPVRQALLATSAGQMTPLCWTLDGQLWVARITARTPAPALDFEGRRKLVLEIQEEEAGRRMDAELRHLDAKGRLHPGFSSLWGRMGGIFINEDALKRATTAEE